MKRFGMIIGSILCVLVLFVSIVYVILPKGPRDPMQFDDPWHQSRPAINAKKYVVVTGTTYATQAAMDVLGRGGNAFDAAVAALLMLNVTHGEAASFPGIAPLVIYDARRGLVNSYVGAGTAPAAATLERFKERGYKTVPDLNIWSQLIPASPDVIIALLKDYGTMSFGELAAPAIKIARDGFPVSKIMSQDMDLSLIQRAGFAYLLPYNTQVYLDGQWWRPLYHKDRLRFPDLANSLEGMAQAEKNSRSVGNSREDGLQAARDYFYKGPLAQKIVQLENDQGGLIAKEDLANYSGYWEKPLCGSYGEYTFYTNGTWNQGITGLMALQIMEGINLKAMGQNSPEYIHTINQAIELAMADREAYVADPKFVQTPVDILLSKEYAAARRERMTYHAFKALPPPGKVQKDIQTGFEPSSVVDGQDDGISSLLLIGKDTTHLAIIDQWGNSISMTPSDFPKSPMVPGTGLTLGNRMTQFRLDPKNVDVLLPGKRPRVTPHAIIVFRNGKFFMSFGTPGDDMQTQALIQVFLNMAVFDMDIQHAIEAPRFRSMSMPATFAPHKSYPATLWLESSLYYKTAVDLRFLGYTVIRYPDLDNRFGAVGAVIQLEDGLKGGSDPREETWADGK